MQRHKHLSQASSSPHNSKKKGKTDALDSGKLYLHFSFLFYQDFCSYGLVSGDRPYFDGKVLSYKPGEWEKKFDTLIRNKKERIMSYIRKRDDSDMDRKAKGIDNMISDINSIIHERYDDLSGIDKFVEDALSGRISGFYLDLVYKQLLPYIK